MMAPASFISWLADMKSAGLARSDAECARLLGISANSVVSLKKNGADTRTALACRALLHRLEPYS
jgi:DNA-binding CsgD family transcriptional regulator